MVNYIKYFTVFLVVLWIVSFWFVFKSGGISSPGKHPEYLDENNHDTNSKWAKRIAHAEQELTLLEAKIKKNEQIIQNLK